MVVVQAQPSTSTTSQKKNRRKLHKKSAKSTSRDAEMQEGAHLDPAEPNVSNEQDDDEIMIDDNNVAPPSDGAAPAFPPLSAAAQRTTLKSEMRRVPVPPHRMTPLKKDWVNIFGPLTEMMGLQVRMNVQRRCVEIRVSDKSCRRSFVSHAASWRHPSRHRSIPRKWERCRRVRTS